MIEGSRTKWRIQSQQIFCCHNKLYVYVTEGGEVDISTRFLFYVFVVLFCLCLFVFFSCRKNCFWFVWWKLVDLCVIWRHCEDKRERSNFSCFLKMDQKFCEVTLKPGFSVWSWGKIMKNKCVLETVKKLILMVTVFILIQSYKTVIFPVLLSISGISLWEEQWLVEYFVTGDDTLKKQTLIW